MGKRIFNREYKLQTIRQIIIEGKSVSEVSKSLNIAQQILYRWLKEFDKYGEEAFKGEGIARLDAEYKISILEKQNKQLKKENEILKKYRAFLKERRKKKQNL